MSPTRRDLLSGAAGAAIIACVPDWSEAKEPSTTPSPGGGSNGGKVQLNLNALQTGGEYPFINHLKTAQRWAYIRPEPRWGTTAVDPNDLDSDGYPLPREPGGLPNGGVTTVIYVPTPAESGNNQYVVTWTGTGAIAVMVGGTLVKASGTIVTITNARVIVSILANANGDMGNLAIVALSDKHAYDLGEIFGKRFKENLIDANIGVIRFLNWGGYLSYNSSSIRFWQDRKPVTYVYYAGFELRKSLWGGIATGQLLDGVYDFESSNIPLYFGSRNTLQDKDAVICYFDTQSYTLTMTGYIDDGSGSGTPGNVMTVTNMNGGPENIQRGAYVEDVDFAGSAMITGYVGGTPGGVGQYTFAGAPFARGSVSDQRPLHVMNQMTFRLPGVPGSQFPIRGPNAGIDNHYGTVAGVPAILIYDADIGVWIKSGGDAGEGSQFLDNGVPPELMLQLCVELRMHPWFNMPYLSCDPIPGDSVGWAHNLAQYVKANKPSWMIPRFEVAPNECWNTIFYATGYAAAKAAALWGLRPNSWDAWVGKVASVTGQKIGEVFGNDFTPAGWASAQYQAIVGMWTFGSGNGGPTEPWTSHSDRILSTSYMAHGGSVSAKNVVSHICISGYYQDTYPPLLTSLSKVSGTISDGLGNAGTILDLTEVTGHYVTPGTLVSGPDVQSDTYIIDHLDGAGGVGTYVVSKPQRSKEIKALDNSRRQTINAYAVTGAPSILKSFVESSLVPDPAKPISPSPQFQGALLNRVNNVIPNWVTWARHNGPADREIGVTLYEGGWDSPGSNYSMDYNSIVFYRIAKLRPEQHTLADIYLKGVVDAGGEFPSWFQYGTVSASVISSVGGRSINVGNPWGIWDPDIYGPSMPAWAAIKTFSTK